MRLSKQDFKRVLRLEGSIKMNNQIIWSGTPYEKDQARMRNKILKRKIREIRSVLVYGN